MENHPHKSRYARLAAAFAASSFALLTMLSMQQYEAKQTVASLLDNGVTLTDYGMR